MSIFSPTITAIIKKARRITWWEFSGPDRDEVIDHGNGIKHNMKQTMCGLCGQSGIIDTRGKVFTAAGFECGVLRWCICPNGRAYKRKLKVDVPPEAYVKHAQSDRYEGKKAKR